MSAAITEAQARARQEARANEDTRRRPRVLHLINNFDIGGTERQAIELLKRLDRERYDVRLAALRNTGPLYEQIETQFPNVPEFPLTSFFNANALKQLARLRRLMVREKIDILHAHDFYSGLLGATAARLAGVRVIACQRHLKLTDRKVHELGTRVIHRLAHRVLVNSEAIREVVIGKGSARTAKIVVVRNGVVGTSDPLSPETADSASMRPHELRRELGCDPDVKLIGMVARMQPVKGHRFFLEAAATVLRARPEVHFVLVGDGPLRAELQDQIARLGIVDRVHLLGDRTDAATLIAQFDLLVLASLHEGSPNAVMEGMVASVPVVATAVGGTKELITDHETGYLAPPADSEALAARILFALGDGANRTKITTAARSRIAAAHGMQRMVDAVEQLYDELMGRP
jgi:glycosyltransferase involved in cell wall biosynthesis